MRRLFAGVFACVFALAVGLIQTSAAVPSAGPSLTATPARDLMDGQRISLTAFGFQSLVDHGTTFTPEAYQCPAGEFPKSAVDPSDRWDADRAALASDCVALGIFPVTGNYTDRDPPTSVEVVVHATLSTPAAPVLPCAERADQCVIVAAGAAEGPDGFGLGLASTPIAFIPGTRQLPTAPGSVVATAGKGSATLSWRPPAFDGGSPITGYVVRPYRYGDAQPTRRFDSQATRQTITGLAPGAGYTFRVAAVTRVGTGPQSVDSNEVAPK